MMTSFYVSRIFVDVMLGECLNYAAKSKNCKIKVLENYEASYGIMPLTAEINVALRKQICRKIGSERVNDIDE